MFNSIIVGVDGREGGRDAIALARALAAPGARLVLVNAYPYDVAPSRASSGAYDAALRDATEELLAQERREAAVPNAELAVIADTSPARALQTAAEREEADLIVVGSTHRRSALGQVLAGDIARGTLHDASCPVVVAPRGFDADLVIARVGVGYDGSSESRHALALAEALARGFGAELVVREAVDDTVPVAAAYGYGYAWTDVVDDQCRAAEEGMAEVLAQVDVPATGDVETGSASRALESLSDDVDLLVIGSRGFGRFGRVVLGSVSDHLVHHGHSPVLVVPRGPGDVEEPKSPAVGAAQAR
jgi:nucleotide-binding universal stress UspA family protein